MVLVNYKKKEICHLISRMILVEHMVGLKPDVKKTILKKILRPFYLTLKITLKFRVGDTNYSIIPLLVLL